jgi:lincosamide nucleotidyltransferase A/C/D/E
MEAERALAVVARLTESGVSLWLDGGWGVDALLGSQTRPHDDLDLIVRFDDVGQLDDALAQIGYVRVHGAPPLSFEMTDPDGHQIDVHPVRFNHAGDGHYRMANGIDWVYPPGSLSATGKILGRDVPCQTPEMQMRAHTTGYALDAAHRADVEALAERFDLVLPRFDSA